MKKFFNFILFRIVFRVLVVWPLFYALHNDSFEILAIVSFATAIIGPWEAWKFIENHGFKGFGVEITGGLLRDREEKTKVIDAQTNLIEALKKDIATMLEKLDKETAASSAKSKFIGEISDKIRSLEEKLNLLKEKERSSSLNVDTILTKQNPYSEALRTALLRHLVRPEK